MPRPCITCEHPERPKIEQALVSGTSFRKVSKRFGIGMTALFRHKEAHILPAVAKAQHAIEASQGDDLLAKVTMLESDARRIQRKAEAAGDLRTAISAIRELTRVIELLAKLRGELQAAPQINIAFVVPVLLDCLSDYPEVKQVVATRLRELDAASL